MNFVVQVAQSSEQAKQSDPLKKSPSLQLSQDNPSWQVLQSGKQFKHSKPYLYSPSTQGLSTQSGKK